ncbi:MAG: pksL 5, partial [Acidobacteria bacterium]|nr:pksL 5 [Acidobacteriota bacterium]
MISFLEYVFGEVKDRRLPKPDAIELLRQFQRPKLQPAPPPLHPLLGANTSDLEGPRFSCALTGGEFFLADHVVNGRSVLPGVACLEMARAAVERATGAVPTAVRLRNAVFARPLLVGGPVTAHVALSAEENGEIAFEIYTAGEAGDLVHASGHALLVDDAEQPRVDLAGLQARCTAEQSGAQCYETFRWLGMQYGPAHRGLQGVASGVDANGQPFVLATIALPAVVASTRGEYGLHPSMLDAALQAVIGWREESESEAGRPSLPFSVAQVDLFAACPAAGYAYLRQTEAAQGALRKLDVYLCDEEGRVCVRLQGLTLRRLETESKPDETATLLFQPSWKEQIAEGEGDLRHAQHLVVLCGQPAEIASAEGHAFIERELPGSRIVALEAEGAHGARAIDAVTALFALLQERMREKAAGELLLQVIVPAGSDGVTFAGISGLVETARLENPKLVPQVIAVEAGSVDTLVAILRENGGAGAQRRVRYVDGQRQVASWVELPSEPAEIATPFVDGGVYLISGGAGGLGLLFAREIAARTKESTLLLTGRSPLSAEKEQALDALRAAGARVDYHQADVTDRAAVEALAAAMEREHGRLDGILHSAGIVRDAFLINKTAAEVHDVLAPKIAGAVNLDEATAHLPLSFFVLCSSLAGATGNIGQADYAAANAFLDAYALHRQELVANGKRHGQSLSLNWPLWEEGGMQVDAATAARMRHNLGIVPLTTAAGMEALARALASGRPQLLVLPGEGRRIRQLLTQRAVRSQVQAPAAAPVAIELGDDALQARAVHYLKKLLAPTLGLPVDRIEAETPLETYGI